MLQREVSTIPQFIESVLRLRLEWYPDNTTPEVWFRGSENRSYPLLPGAYWRSKCDERSLVLTFRSMVPSYLSREPTDDWEWYYLMQHYGLPTRLLDWTESPLVALYFAIVAKEPAGLGPCVWAIDPVALNAVAQGFTDGTIIAPLSSDPDNPSRYWLTDYCRRGQTPRTFNPDTGYRDNSKPLAVFPKRHNPRIVAQRGVFTIHGTEEVAIDQVMARADSLGDRLAQFCFTGNDRKQIARDLYCLGVSKSALFPEPQTVADDLKQMYDV